MDPQKIVSKILILNFEIFHFRSSSICGHFCFDPVDTQDPLSLVKNLRMVAELQLISHVISTKAVERVGGWVSGWLGVKPFG